MYDLPLIIKFASVCLCVIKNPEFPEIQTVIILVVPLPNRPEFETLDTWAGVNQFSVSHFSDLHLRQFIMNFLFQIFIVPSSFSKWCELLS